MVRSKPESPELAQLSATATLLQELPSTRSSLTRLMTTGFLLATPMAEAVLPATESAAGGPIRPLDSSAFTSAQTRWRLRRGFRELAASRAEASRVSRILYLSQEVQITSFLDLRILVVAAPAVSTALRM